MINILQKSWEQQHYRGAAVTFLYGCVYSGNVSIQVRFQREAESISDGISGEMLLLYIYNKD